MLPVSGREEERMMRQKDLAKRVEHYRQKDVDDERDVRKSHRDELILWVEILLIIQF